MSAFRGFDWVFCSDPLMILSISLRSSDSPDSATGGFDDAVLVAICPDESRRRSSSAFIISLCLFKEPSLGAEDKDNKFPKSSALNAPFTGSDDDEDEFESDIWKTS